MQPLVEQLRQQLSAGLEAAARSLGAPEGTPVVLERPRQAGHGDFSASLAMQLARSLRRAPRDIAAALLQALPALPAVARAEVAGAGFINFFLAPAVRHQVVAEVLARGTGYGRVDLGRGQPLQVEFVSANPTGPLHVGHGRGAAYGASLASVLDFAGWKVQREYYVNDYGRQMDILALSTWLRYLDLQGVALAFPPNAYQGDYVRAMAQALLAQDGARYRHDAAAVGAGLDAIEDPEARLDALIDRAKTLLGADGYARVHAHALQDQLADCRQDLEEFGVRYDRWYSERSLHEGGAVAAVLAVLEAGGHLYRTDGALWFRSTAFGDEKDRVVQRENGQYTYFASDIAYHAEKLQRGFVRVIDVWGADHHGYIPRVKAALQALGLDAEALTVALVQFAVLYRDGKKASMSTRSGEFVTLRQLRAEVGNDAARFFYVLRKSDQHLDFDLDLARSQSNDNPVYYIQYAHARVCSVLAQWGGDTAALAQCDRSVLDSEQEVRLLGILMDFPDVVADAARDLAPHLVAFYLKDLAAEFHSYYNTTHFLAEAEAQRLARLSLVLAVRQVLRNGLALLGVGAPEKM